METYHIARISFRSENKEGVPYTIKKGQNAGKPFEMCSILLKEKDKWCSSCIFDKDHPAYGWKEGQAVELILE